MLMYNKADLKDKNIVAKLVAKNTLYSTILARNILFFLVQINCKIFWFYTNPIAP